jgi:hypothetical protein
MQLEGLYMQSKKQKNERQTLPLDLLVPSVVSLTNTNVLILTNVNPFSGDVINNKISFMSQGKYFKV